jgi:AcrR family transcriptional regulator
MISGARNYSMRARARSVEGTRARIIAAARSAFVTERYEQVTLTGVAREAGVTQQTLLNHFSSKEGLFLAAVEILGTEINELRGVVRPSDVIGCVQALMRQYEALGDANVRLAAVADIIPVVAQIAEVARGDHRHWLETIFADDLPAEAAPRRRTVAALYAATDVGTWKLLRRDLHHSRRETTTILQTLIRSILAAAQTP